MQLFVFGNCIFVSCTCLLNSNALLKSKLIHNQNDSQSHSIDFQSKTPNIEIDMKKDKEIYKAL